MKKNWGELEAEAVVASAAIGPSRSCCFDPPTWDRVFCPEARYSGCIKASDRGS